ncbi:cytochrome c oxidase subunit II [Aestuariispira insulae]|uniref:Cytochrome c oxidase subunit 2 n=1 Tax=Aestuariispira insulae TaxID=1461337 RepID=A0A3D9HMZ6_9PROT|nr:cytochrome c oxidase subunit II [Aestuariispira insulae]RED50838.1 cytochrome c oxidase subunit 2 [Aestuariispira insulae]
MRWFGLFRASGTLSALLAILFLSPAAYADSGEMGDWGVWMRESVTPVMDKIHELNNILHIISVVIVLFILVLLVIVCVRFRASKNPVPSKTSHNTKLEILWTTIPILILVMIAVPSFRLLYFMNDSSDAEMTLKITGNQWFWTYTYPDHDDLTFDAFLVAEEDLEDGQPRLLTTDNPVVLPANTKIRLIGTSVDVIHAWAMPQFGVKFDTVPGRLQEAPVFVTKEGTYYGQCSELCGVDHGYMPIEVRVVPREEFDTWIEEMKEEYADNSGTTPVNSAPAGVSLALGSQAEVTEESKQ